MPGSFLLPRKIDYTRICFITGMTLENRLLKTKSGQNTIYK